VADRAVPSLEAVTDPEDRAVVEGDIATLPPRPALPHLRSLTNAAVTAADRSDPEAKSGLSAL